jgi:hypothetical protein
MAFLGSRPHAARYRIRARPCPLTNAHVNISPHSACLRSCPSIRSVNGSTALVELNRLFSFVILYTVGRTPWAGDQPDARPLPAHRINAHRHTCLEWDSNSRSQHSSERRQFMPHTARPATVIGFLSTLSQLVSSASKRSRLLRFRRTFIARTACQRLYPALLPPPIPCPRVGRGAASSQLLTASLN